MAQDRFLISPASQQQGADWSGLQTNLRPFAIGDSAFSIMKNCNVFRGRIRKRFGSWLLGSAGQTDTNAVNNARLRIEIGKITLAGGGTAALAIPGIYPLQAGQHFSILGQVYEVTSLGAVAGYITTGTGTMALNTVAQLVTFAGSGAPLTTPVYYYPALPVMGLITFQQGQINDEPVIAFDTQFAYQRSSGAWSRLAGGSDVWTGTDSDFFWGTTWRGTSAADNNLFVSNFNAPDNIRYFNQTAAVWTIFTPQYGPGVNDIVNTARLIVVYKGRLVLLNTVENGISYFNRARWSQFGDPLQADAFRDDIPGKGSFEDCPVKQQIITAEFLKDILIVYLESSTWTLVWKENAEDPFEWQQLNTELGAESTFSVVPFDKVMIGIGNVGIHACNGTNVERIDRMIPNEVFDIHNENDGITRVNGIRDYFAEMVYWTFPAAQNEINIDNVFPNRVLVYNYVTGAWAFHDDSFTVFGYFQQQNDLLWQDISSTWGSTELTWNSPVLQGKFRQVVAGNQEGFTFQIMPDISRNAPSLQITNLIDATPLITLTIYDHNLSSDDYIYIENSGTSLDDNIFVILSVIDSDTITIGVFSFTGPYLGGGTVARVSRFEFWTKQYNFYDKQGKNASINKVEFLVDRTDKGAFTVDYYASSSTDVSLLTDAQASGSLVGSGIVDTSPYAIYPLESNQTRLWHPAYMDLVGSTVQLKVYFSDNQMLNFDVAMNSDVEIHALLIMAQPAGRIQM